MPTQSFDPRGVLRRDADLTGTAAALAARRSRTLAPTYRLFYDRPVEVASAEGAWITERDGTRLLDAYNNVPVIGHSHPGVRDAVAEQLGRINTHTRYLDEFVVDYGERLLAKLPEHLDRLVLACSGSEANDLALQLARGATGARGVIVTSYAYHGTTSAVLEISPSLLGATPPPEHVVAVRLPDSKLDAEAAAAEFRAEVAAAIDLLDECGFGVAAIVVDAGLTSDGIVAGDPHWLESGIRLVREAGGLHVADEVQAGFCRLGGWWGFEGFGGRPDIVTLGKPMGNGLPIAALVASERLLSTTDRRYFNTFAGTPATVAAAGVVLDELDRLDAPARTARLGEQLRAMLEDAAARCSVPARVRGAGLLAGLELLDGAPGTAGELAELLRAEGVLVGTTGPRSEALKIRPPLIIDESQLEVLERALDRALPALGRGE